MGCHALLLPDSGIEPESPMSPALAGGFFTVRGARGHFKRQDRKHRLFWLIMNDLLCVTHYKQRIVVR